MPKTKLLRIIHKFKIYPFFRRILIASLTDSYGLIFSDYIEFQQAFD